MIKLTPKAAEELVRNHLVGKGFTVSRQGESENANGIDIVAIKDTQAFLIEVKLVSEGRRNTTVTPVLTAGKTCDYVALVTPKQNIIFQPMTEHLALCSKNGSRGVTQLVRITDLTK